MLKECALDSLPDNELMKQFQQGNTDAFGFLFLRHKPKLISIALTYMRNLPDAEDMVQSAFLSAMRGAKNFEYKAQVSTWLVRIVINNCLTNLNLLKKRPLAISYEYALSQLEEAIEIYDPYLEVELKLALKKLPMIEKRTLLLMQYFGFSAKELADLEHCNVSTIKSRCFRAKAKIRKDQRLKEKLFTSHSRGQVSPGNKSA